MGKRERQGIVARFRAWLNGIPHLFAKLTVMWCISFGTAASVYALRIMSRTDKDPAALLGVILAFCGGELVILGAKTIFKQKE